MRFYYSILEFAGALGQLQGRGLVVIGVPSNDFGWQEAGSNQEMIEFCERSFGISFVLTEKSKVRGGDTYPFYLWARRTY